MRNIYFSFPKVIFVHLIGFIPTKCFSLNHIHMLINVTCDIFPNSCFEPVRFVVVKSVSHSGDSLLQGFPVLEGVRTAGFSVLLGRKQLSPRQV